MEPIEDTYFMWLAAKVMPGEGGRNLDVLRVLHTTEFVWQITGDDNRAVDGVDLRHDFIRSNLVPGQEGWDTLGASVLEMMIAFCYRAEFLTDRPVKEWFWRMMENLNLSEYRRVSPSQESTIRDVLYILVWRLYDDHGNGGLWPLKHPHEDQRGVEIFYQFAAYAQENNLT
jgi:hypothetical protein